MDNDTTEERPLSPEGLTAGDAPPDGGQEEALGASGQYVTFAVDSERFAFPMHAVREIIRVPHTVKVPLTPGSLVGLANLRGSILPVLDLRALLGLPTAALSDVTRVIVADCGETVGLVVDRVERVVEVEPEQVDSADGLRSRVRADLLTGVLKGSADEGMVQLLNVQAIVDADYAELLALARARHRAPRDGEVSAAAEASDADSEEEDTVQLVSFVMDGQEYALPIREVDEIVRAPEVMNHIPCTDEHVLGLITLRERLLPLVSLRRLCGLPQGPVEDHNRILVVRPEDSAEDAAVGLVVDQVREVLRVPAASQDRLPSLLQRGRERSQVESVCRLEDGRRLVSVLSAGSLIEASGARDDQANRGAEVTEVRATETDASEDTQLVVFELAEQEYSVMIDAVQEIIRVPGQMNRVPGTADFIQGLINLRGSVLPVLDMRLRFGLPTVEPNDRQRILVLNLQGAPTGFIVDSVSEVLRLARESIEDSPTLSADQTRVMGRVANLDQGRRLILVLDEQAMLDSDEAQALTVQAA